MKSAFSWTTSQPEQIMGGKASNYMQSDRPESGGADKDLVREKSGLLERDKEKFATGEAEKKEGRPDGKTD